MPNNWFGLVSRPHRCKNWETASSLLHVDALFVRHSACEHLVHCATTHNCTRSSCHNSFGRAARVVWHGSWTPLTFKYLITYLNISSNFRISNVIEYRFHHTRCSRAFPLTDYVLNIARQSGQKRQETLCFSHLQPQVHCSPFGAKWYYVDLCSKVIQKSRHKCPLQIRDSQHHFLRSKSVKHVYVGLKTPPQLQGNPKPKCPSSLWVFQVHGTTPETCT